MNDSERFVARVGFSLAVIFLGIVPFVAIVGMLLIDPIVVGWPIGRLLNRTGALLQLLGLVSLIFDLLSQNRITKVENGLANLNGSIEAGKFRKPGQVLLVVFMGLAPLLIVLVNLQIADYYLKIAMWFWMGLVAISEICFFVFHFMKPEIETFSQITIVLTLTYAEALTHLLLLFVLLFEDEYLRMAIIFAGALYSLFRIVALNLHEIDRTPVEEVISGMLLRLKNHGLKVFVARVFYVPALVIAALLQLLASYFVT